MIREEIYRKIDAERVRQIEKHGASSIECVIDRPGVALAILVEEVGEIARSLLDGEGTVSREELIQVAAVCVGWLEGLA